MNFVRASTHAPTHAHSSLSWLLSPPLQFSFSFVETHAVSAVKIRPQSLVGWSEEESDEEGDSKTSPIIQAEGVTFPWNIDGELVEMASEVLVRLVEKHHVRVGHSSKNNK